MEGLLAHGSDQVTMPGGYGLEEEAANIVDDKARRVQGQASTSSTIQVKRNARTKANSSPYQTGSNRASGSTPRKGSLLRGEDLPSTSGAVFGSKRPRVGAATNFESFRYQAGPSRPTPPRQSGRGTGAFEANNHSKQRSQVIDVHSDDDDSERKEIRKVPPNTSTRSSPNRGDTSLHGSANEPYHVHDDDEGPESINQFPSSPLAELPEEGKGKGREISSPNRPVIKGRMKDRMQKRDGTVAGGSGPASSRPILQSSNLPPIPAEVDLCFMDNAAVPLKGPLTLTVGQSGYVLTATKGARTRVEYTFVQGMELYRDNAPTFQIELSMLDKELHGLQHMLEGDATEFIGKQMYFILKAQESSRLAAEALFKWVNSTVEGRATRIPSSAGQKYRSIFQKAEMRRRSEAEARRRSEAEARRRIEVKTPTPSEYAGEAAELRLLQQSSGVQQPIANGSRAKVVRPVKGKAKATEDDKQTTLSFTSGARRSTRVTRARHSMLDSDWDDARGVSYLEDEDNPKYDTVAVFDYPPRGPTELTMTRGARRRFKNMEFLNDVGLEFGLRYTLDIICPEDLRSSVYLFSSFFYDKLSQRGRGERSDDDNNWRAYDTVKRWTRSVDIFEKDFIFVPINESFHWYSALIINPKGILRSKDKVQSLDSKGASSPTEAVVTEMAPAPPSPAPPSPALRSPAPPRPAPPSATCGANDDAQEEHSNTDESRDELDILDKDEGTVAHGIGFLDATMDRMSIDGEADERAVEGVVEGDVAMAKSPQPIQSGTYEVYTQQVQEVAGVKKSTSPTPEAAQLDGSSVDVDILNDKDNTYIITFDSLTGPTSHKSVCHDLQRWLWFEARDKGKVEPGTKLPKAQYMEAKVPNQPNSSDCGVYLIHYFDCILRDPKKTIGFLGKKRPAKMSPSEWKKEANAVWESDKPKTMRQEWVQRFDEQKMFWESVHHCGPPKDDSAAKDVAIPDESQASVELATQQPTARKTSPPAVNAAGTKGQSPSPPLSTKGNGEKVKGSGSDDTAGQPKPGVIDLSDGSAKTPQVKSDSESESDGNLFGDTDVGKKLDAAKTSGFTDSPDKECSTPVGRQGSVPNSAGRQPTQQPSNGNTSRSPSKSPLFSSPIRRGHGSDDDMPPGAQRVVAEGTPEEVEEEEEEEEEVEEPLERSREATDAESVLSRKRTSPSSLPPTSPRRRSLERRVPAPAPSKDKPDKPNAPRKSVNSILGPYRDDKPSGQGKRAGSAGTARKRPPPKGARASKKLKNSAGPASKQDVIFISDDSD